MEIKFETDWLASKPVFYNELTKKVSHNINDVIDYKNLQFHPEGFNNYLDFGYSVFQQTPIKGVKFLRHSSILLKTEDELKIIELPDPIEKYLDLDVTEIDVFNLLNIAVNKYESSTNNNLIIPTSGGFDSRLLNLLVSEKSRIFSYTYGISDFQNNSQEVVYARQLSKILGTKWAQIKLGNFTNYLDEWDSIFGISTHAHGMYHMEFYNKIAGDVNVSESSVLSGIIGDIWAGNLEIKELKSSDDLINLSYSHGVNANSSYSKLKNEQSTLKDEYYKINRAKLKNPKVRIVEAMRLKIILLSYLITIPERVGYKVWTPFLDIENAMSMLSIDENRRQNRIWQKELFEQNNIALELFNLNFSSGNSLDLQGLIKNPVPLLDKNLMQELIDPSYINWINNNINQNSTFWKTYNFLSKIPKFNSLAKRIGFLDKRIEAYNAYCTLRPIENILKKRNLAI